MEYIEAGKGLQVAKDFILVVISTKGCETVVVTKSTCQIRASLILGRRGGQATEKSGCFQGLLQQLERSKNLSVAVHKQNQHLSSKNRISHRD